MDEARLLIGRPHDHSGIPGLIQKDVTRGLEARVRKNFLWSPRKSANAPRPSARATRRKLAREAADVLAWCPQLLPSSGVDLEQAALAATARDARACKESPCYSLSGIVLSLLVVFPRPEVGRSLAPYPAKNKCGARSCRAVREDRRTAASNLLATTSRKDGRGAAIETLTRTLFFGRGFSLRLAAWSGTINEFRARWRKPCRPSSRRTRRCWSGWGVRGKMTVEGGGGGGGLGGFLFFLFWGGWGGGCYAAAVPADPTFAKT